MNDPARLLSGEADDFEKQLLGSWGAEQPSDAARAKVLAIVGVGAAAGAAVVAGGSLAPKAGAAGAAAIAKWAVIGALGVAAAGAAVEYVRVARHEASVAAPSPTVVVAPRTVETVPAAVEATATPPATLESPPSRSGTSLRRAPSSEKSARATDPALGEQVSALDRARRTLGDGDATGAVRQLDDYEARFPHGALVEEAEVLRVESLLAEGDHASAVRVGSRFLVAHPDSPHVARVRALLGQAPGP